MSPSFVHDAKTAASKMQAMNLVIFMDGVLCFVCLYVNRCKIMFYMLSLKVSLVYNVVYKAADNKKNAA